MIVMMAVTETEMMTGMAMGEKENGVLEMMTDMVGTETHMAVMGTGTTEMMIAMAEMATGMTTIVPEAEVLMIISMAQEVEALTAIGTVLMKMRVNILQGFSSL